MDAGDRATDSPVPDLRTTRSQAERIDGRRFALSNPVTTPWHALAPDEALQELASTTDGLTEAEARARLERVGLNALVPVPPTPAWRIFLGQLTSIVVLLLAAAAAIAMATGDPVDAGAIGVVLVINIVLGFATELRARRAMEGLLALEVPRAVIIREGRQQDVDARELVPGDIIVLEAGQSVPADARLLRATELRIVEAPLTGESAPVHKIAEEKLATDTPLPDRVTMVYKATGVAAGTARALVVATGMSTELGRIGALMRGITDERTPLERRLDVLGRRLALVAIGVGVGVAALSALQGAGLGAVLQTAIAVAVAAVPEGLPAVITITMAVGMRRMARRRALVRRLPVVESLGAATVICTDKTGTLTTGEMTAVVLWLAGREWPLTADEPERRGGAPWAISHTPGPAGSEAESQMIDTALRIGTLANRAEIGPTGSPSRGDPTEVALLVAAHHAGIERDALLAQWPEIGEVPFSSERMLMATFNREASAGASGDAIVAHVKGAPRRVVPLCDRWLAPGGSTTLDDAGRATILEANEALASRGLRVLALAYGPAAAPMEKALGSLMFAGLVGLIDPPAPGARETIRHLRAAGIRTLMLTGDQRRAAETIARELGMSVDGDQVLDGREVDGLDEDQLAARLERIVVVSRVSPEAKLRIVAALQRRGEIVAMLGDGVNDAAALKKADAGVAMGGRGTDIAKEAAGVVLQDDRFETIAAAVEEGRVIFDNIRKFVFYLFSCNLAEILVLLGAGVAGLPLPLLPLQILWLNLVTDTFPALALALEPAETQIMSRPPRNPAVGLITGGLLRRTGVHAAVITASTLGVFAWGLSAHPDEIGRAVTLSFLTLGFAQIFHVANARSETPLRLGQLITGNPFALAAVGWTVLLQVAAITVAPLASLLDLSAPHAHEWGVVLVASLVPAAFGLATRRRHGRSRAGPAS